MSVDSTRGTRSFRAAGGLRVHRSFGGLTCESAEMMRSVLIDPPPGRYGRCGSFSPLSTRQSSDCPRRSAMCPGAPRLAPRGYGLQTADGGGGVLDRGVELARRVRAELPLRLGVRSPERLQPVVDLLHRPLRLLPRSRGGGQLPGDRLDLLLQLLARRLRDVGRAADDLLQEIDPA